MSEALKPCPFCGRTCNLVVDCLSGDDWFVSCEEDLKCRMSLHAVHPTKEAAISAWNTRPVEDALVEALKAAEVMLRALLVSTPCSVSTNDSGKFRNINSFGTLKEVQAALKLAAE